MENATPEPRPHPRSSFSLVHLAIVAVLALGAGAGTAWLLTGGGSPTQTASVPAASMPVARPSQPAPAPTQKVAVPSLAAPESSALAQPAPVARRDLNTRPAAAPMPLPAHGTSGSSEAQLDYGDAPGNERVLAPAPRTASQPQGPAKVGDCDRFTTEVVVDGQRMTRTGTACLQSDGTWRIQSEK